MISIYVGKKDEIIFGGSFGSSKKFAKLGKIALLLSKECLKRRDTFIDRGRTFFSVGLCDTSDDNYQRSTRRS